MTQSQKEMMLREMKRLTAGGGLIGEAAVLALSGKKIHKEPFGPDSKRRSLQDGEIIEFKSPNVTSNNVCFQINDDREIWLSQIQGLYFTIRDSNNEYDFPTFITKDGCKTKLGPFCDLESFIGFVKNKKFKVQQKVDYHVKVSFSGTTRTDCANARNMVWNENYEFIGFDSLIDYCLDKLNNSNYKDLCDGYLVSGRLYYFYEV